MAQKYLETFQKSGETAYATGRTPAMALAALNKGIKFIAVKSGGSVKFNIDRAKRLKSVANVAKTGKFGTDIVAQKDLLGQVEWDTIDTASGAEQIIGVHVDINEPTDLLEDMSAYETVISERVQNILTQKEENAITKIAGAATMATAPIVIDGSADEATVKVIADKATDLSLLVDDFKAYSDNIVVLVHPKVAEAFGRVQGQSYSTGTNTFPEGLGKGFRYNGVDYFVSPLMNAIAGSAAGKTVGAIVMDAEAYANAGLTNGMTAFDDTDLGERYVGHKFFDLDVVVDATRIAAFEFDATAGISVND